MCALWLAALEVTLGVRLRTSREEGVGERAEGLSMEGGVTGRKRGQSDP